MLLKHTAVRKCHACPFNLICSYSQTNCVDGTFFDDIFSTTLDKVFSKN